MSLTLTDMLHWLTSQGLRDILPWLILFAICGLYIAHARMTPEQRRREKEVYYEDHISGDW